MTGRVLAGCGVLVTRPHEQAAALCAGLEALGAHVVALPTIAVEPLTDTATRQRAHTLVPVADWLVFVSPNAVTSGLALLEAECLRPGGEPRIAAVGAGTARALNQRGIEQVIRPATGGGARALLDEQTFTAGAGERVIIVRGDGGRDTLADALRARGAAVDYLAVYRRAMADVDTGAARAGWRDGSLQFTIVTSVAGLENLLTLIGSGADRDRLFDTDVITVSERIAAQARAWGFRRAPRVAAEPSDEGLIDAVCRVAAPDRERR
ncbi:MAG TPA: uroporphyrinogen-III synthase [Gammaproteobacteria bacterium]|nr:uroporphyrinogen-III synthase [Gammaproteobacteria bacterium]